mmetsp:Transcript_32578/g.93756  ORF Transcript_32578/g.93756 Transcript_32578/m.93756 type:complete len:207 (+) Transcript_32578:383-1003(+)
MSSRSSCWRRYSSMNLPTAFSRTGEPVAASGMAAAWPFGFSLPVVAKGTAGMRTAPTSGSESRQTEPRLLLPPFLKLRKSGRTPTLTEGRGSRSFLGEEGEEKALRGCTEGGLILRTACPSGIFPDIRSERFCMSLKTSARQWSICAASRYSSTAAWMPSSLTPTASPSARVSATQTCGRRMCCLMICISRCVCLKANATILTFLT